MRFALLLPLVLPLVAVEPITITNPLKQSWPWELVSRDYPAGTFTGPVQVTVGGENRPAQVETLPDGKQRLWFIATLTGKDTQISVPVSDGTAPTALSAKREGGDWLIATGVGDYRIAAEIAGGRPFAQTPHWFRGMRVAGGAWDGRAWSTGSAVVASYACEQIAAGPVFASWKLTYRFSEPGETGTVQAPVLALGKQTHRNTFGVLPMETLPKREAHYEVLLRAVVGDPWFEVVERYRLPRDPSVPTYGIHHYQIHWGKPGEGVPAAGAWGEGFQAVDTVLAARWFEYDSFGGNNKLLAFAAKPREKQRGRPFVQMRPRWYQGPGSQEFLATSGGTGGGDEADAKQDTAPQAPMLGVVAAYPSKWVGPYAATIAAYATGNERAWVRFPMSGGDGGGGNDGDSDSNWYGQRCYALVAATRGSLGGTGEFDSFVRRHTDWTLDAVMNRYVLEWKRDESKAGPAIIWSAREIRQLAADLKSGKDTPLAATAKPFLDDYRKHRETAKKKDDPEAKKSQRWLDSNDGRLLAMLLGDAAKANGPNASQYLGRRYQADDVNPTNYGNRRLVNSAFPGADLARGDKPFGDAGVAAIGYIYSDLDAWPGWQSGWSPGNPNFHTDKYQASIFAAASMRDHPHAQQWMDFGMMNLKADLDKVMTAPDGVGMECPGYSGYSFGLQMETAKPVFNSGLGNPIADHPYTKASGSWHRNLLTPTDVRLGFRHAAPIGDTHRWASGMGAHGFGLLARFFAAKDPAFAAEMLAARELCRERADGKEKPEGAVEALTDLPQGIEPADPKALDWSSRHWYGFGLIARNGFGTARESFLTVKAGPTQGHYHNDEQSWHFYSDGVPLSLDYNCSYHPRGDHAALHNTVTFGNAGTVEHNGRKTQVQALEQPFGVARVGAFVGSPIADVLVSERSGDSLTMSPLDPHDAEFSRGYPSRQVAPWVHRRTLLLVKGGGGPDYLVVREDTAGTEPQQANVHVLARDATVDGQTVRMRGQWSLDADLHVVRAEGLKIEQRYWGYCDEWMQMPDAIIAKPGESTADWGARVKGALDGFKPVFLKKEETGANEQAWHDAMEATQGRAMMPPPGWKGAWTFGEAQIWLRLHAKPASTMIYALVPHRGKPAVVAAQPDGLTVTAGGVTDRIVLGDDGVVRVERGGAATDLLKAGELPALGKIPRGVPAINRPQRGGATR